MPDDFIVFSGDDITAFDLILRGGKGNISVTANVVPQQMSELCELALKGKRVEAEALQSVLFSLHESLFNEANPIPVKWALQRMSLIGSGIRLPLTPLSDEHQPPLINAMAALGIIE